MTSLHASTAIEAISAASESSSIETQQQATQWLTSFMEDDSSWAVWRELLAHKNSNIRFFSANALGQKIRSGWDGLSQEYQAELKDELLSIACHTIDDSVFQDRLCICIAAIAVRTINHIWHSFWQDLIGVFEVGLDGFTLGASSITASSRQSSMGGKIGISSTIFHSRMSAIAIIASLPGELEKSVFNAERMTSATQALQAGIPAILQLIQEVLETTENDVHSPRSIQAQFGRSGSAPPGLLGPSSSSGTFAAAPSTPLTARNSAWSRPSLPTINISAMKRAALLAWQSWVQASNSASSSIPTLGITLRSLMNSRSELLPLLFEALKTPRLSAEAGEILLAILTRRTASDPTSTSSSSGSLSSAFTTASRLAQTSLQQQEPIVISNVLSQLLGLIDSYREATSTISNERGDSLAIGSDCEDEIKLCRAIVLLFVGVGEANVSLMVSSLNEPLVREFLEILLEMTSHPHLDIAELAMQFWNALEYNIYGNTDFSAYYEQLLSIVLRQCTHPVADSSYLLATDGFDDVDPDWLANFTIFRESAIQTFRSCYAVVGDQCMSILQELVNQAGQSGTYDANQWRSLELAYFAATAVNLHVPSSAPLVLQLMQIAFSLHVDITQQTRTVSSKYNNHRHSYAGGGEEHGHFANSRRSNDSAQSTGSSNSSSYTISNSTTTPQHASPTTARATDYDVHFPPLLLVSVARFLGEYRFWLTQQEEPLELLEPALCTVLNWAASPNSELAFSASISFKDLCVTSASMLVPYLPGIMEQYVSRYAELRSEDRITITTGLVCILASVSNNEDVVAALQYLWGPCTSQLKSLIETDLSSTHTSEIMECSASLAAELESLTAICTLSPISASSSSSSVSPSSSPSHLHMSGLHPLATPLRKAPSSPRDHHHHHHELISPLVSARMTHRQHPIINALQSPDESNSHSIWSLLEQIGLIWISAPTISVIQNLLALYTQLIQSGQEAFEPLLPDLIERCSNLFQRRPLPQCLAPLSVSIQHFGRDPTLLYTFSKLLLDISQAVYHQEEDKKPDELAELLVAYFELCSMVIDVNPDVLVHGQDLELLTALIQVCLQTMSSDDPGLQTSALTVLDRLLFGRHTLERDAWRQFVGNTVENLGGEMMNTLVRCVVETTHQKARSALASVLHKLIQGYSTGSKMALIQILSQEDSPGQLFSADEKERIVNIFMSLGSSMMFRRFLNDFTDVANRRAELDVFNTYETQLAEGSGTPDMNKARGARSQFFQNSMPHVL